MRGRAGWRYLGRLWPLIVLGVVSVVIILTSNAPAVYAVAVALGTLGVAIGARVSDLSAVSERAGRVALRMRDPRTIFWSLGAALHLLLLVRVLTEPTNGYDIALWAVGIAAFGAPFVNLNSLRNLEFRPPLTDAAIVVGLMAACIALHAHDLRDWRYAAIGDDIGFFLRVREILEDGIRQPFTIDGMYGNSPMLNSVYQAFVTWIFGGGGWGWKFSSVLSVAVTVPAIYALGCLFAGRIAGIVAAAILISSHYIMAFTHIGYTHLDALPGNRVGHARLHNRNPDEERPHPVCRGSRSRSLAVRRSASSRGTASLCSLGNDQSHGTATVARPLAHGARIHGMRDAVPAGESPGYSLGDGPRHHFAR